MNTTLLDGTELAYEVHGTGEPVLLIGNGPFADTFLPFRSEQPLVGRYRLITYHQRGQAGATLGRAPVTFAEHAADAAALLERADVRRAHIAGHSTGAVIALQLAADRPDLVHTLALLEPPLLGVASTGAFLEAIAPAQAAHAAGDREGALAAFLTVVTSLDWDTCRTVLEAHVPGAVAQAVEDADTLFESYLPALGGWRFGAGEAAAIMKPVLSITGSESARLFVESSALLRSWFPQIEERVIDGIAHLLHMQRPSPVADAIADFFARHPMVAV